MTKEKWEYTTKTERIEWIISRDKERGDSKAVFYVMEPRYHAHPWTACAVYITPDTKEVNTYAFSLEPAQAEAMQKALNMAVRWVNGKRLTGKKREIESTVR